MANAIEAKFLNFAEEVVKFIRFQQAITVSVNSVRMEVYA